MQTGGTKLTSLEAFQSENKEQIPAYKDQERSNFSESHGSAEKSESEGNSCVKEEQSKSDSIASYSATSEGRTASVISSLS